ncbi:MAG: efflux RND transporter periplasmic adaptor subunit [Candidatus Aquirickettsiella gammari]
MINMKQGIRQYGRRVALASVIIVMLVLLGFVFMRAGPLAPVAVTVSTVEKRAIRPALFGIGTVEARYTHKIGPTVAGRVKRVDVQTGDRVKQGQVLAEIDPVDVEEKIRALDASVKRASANILSADANVQETQARKKFAETQVKRYAQLLPTHVISEEAMEVKRQDLRIAQSNAAAAQANLEAVREEQQRTRAERDGMARQRSHLRLVSPVDGIVMKREVDPASTVVAGQAVLEVVEPDSLWINARFDQQRAFGLSTQLPAQITLHTRTGALSGHVSRIEPHADPVTEELLAKISFKELPQPLPSIGELVEVTVDMPTQKILPVIPNASLQRLQGTLGVWVIHQDKLQFRPVKTGTNDLNGYVQVLEGLQGGERIVVHSFKKLEATSRINIVDQLSGSAK